METTLRIDDQIYREAEGDAVRRGMSISRYVETALRAFGGFRDRGEEEAADLNRVIDEMRRRTAHFRIGEMPTREEMNER